MQPYEIKDDWWPQILREILSEKPLLVDEVVVAEIGQPLGPETYRKLFTALVTHDKASAILSHRGGIGHEVQASGPHPSFIASDPAQAYEPRFWIWAADIDSNGLEPLVVSWTSANQTTLLPAQGFLMTYGLVPRLIRQNDITEIHWDDPSAPQYDVVIVHPVSIYDYPNTSHACVKINRNYLQDYATLRQRALVQVYYAYNKGPITEEVKEILQDKTIRQFKLPGRFIELRILSDDNKHFMAQIWGVRKLLDPGPSPITAERWDYGTLKWPGIDEPVSHKKAKGLMMEKVFVSDTVLEMYEGKPEFQVYPESGSVAYGNQWNVGYSCRLNRNIIALELRKLYEGVPPEVVRHWHQHAVDPPHGNLDGIQDKPNVSKRAKRIVYGLLKVGETLALLSSKVLNETLTSQDTIGIKREEMEYIGWWNLPNVEPVTRHIPIKLTEDGFLSRCLDLQQLVIESFREKLLRRLLTRLGIPKDEIKRFRSLRLLNIILCNVNISRQSGLDLIKNWSEITSRQEGKEIISPVKALLALNDLRMAASHHTTHDMKKKIYEALKEFSIYRASLTVGWGIALDTLYDNIGSALEDIYKLLFEEVV